MTDNNKHLVRVGHEFAAAMSDDTPIITIAKMVTELASALDVQSARSEALAAKLHNVCAENAALAAFGGKLDKMRNDLNGEGTGIQGRAEVACQQIALEAAMEEFDAVKTPATDAWVNEQRAAGRVEGVNFAAARLAAAFNHGFIDKPTAEVYDVVKAVLGAKEELATAPDDGLSGEYAEQALNDWAAQLRGGQV
ncbi:hypothetical protein PO486_13680 [Atlantibacter hermannii]|uniref:hypothetical protein n=1 Tax=Atlantibacter hermannii TaxID=565 RepID=UPI002FF80049